MDEEKDHAPEEYSDKPSINKSDSPDSQERKDQPPQDANGEKAADSIIEHDKSTTEQNQQTPPKKAHPTGIPESTGGWFSEIITSSDEPGDERHRHPTGEPQMTGGWFREGSSGSNAGEENDQDAQNQRTPDEKTDRGSTQPLHLPQKAAEVDIGATRVTPSAYKPFHLSEEMDPDRSIADQSTSRSQMSTQDILKKSLGCIFRIIIAFLFFSVFVFVGILSFLVYQYFSISANLPDVQNLGERASQFETTRILDKNGTLLYELVDPNAGRRTYVKLENISPYLIAATIATEDKEYYNHPGFDPVAILRALWQNYTRREIVSGASTITQQLARTLLFSPEERSEQTNQRKAREIVLAAEITRLYSKEEILELYLNENYYGNQAYGIQAAAETYFNSSADKLTIGQASFLAGLPQAPSVYDIFANREDTLQRHMQVLVLMYEASQEKGCIEISNNIQPVCISVDDATQALQEIDGYPFVYHEYIMEYPHWVNYIRSLLEEQFDPQTIYHSGFTVTTTLDPVLQVEAEQMVRAQIAELEGHNATNGALVAIEPSTGFILAMVGSADFYNSDISGQINMSVSPRQPGSSIKPLTYLAAFEKGWTPSTLIWDVPTDFPPSGVPSDPRPPYQPINYDERFHGPVPVRDALANSYNVPAVKTLEFVGIYDDPNTPEKDGLINFARRLGISTLDREDYGLSLTLGGGDVTLLEMTNAFAIFANNGRRVQPVAFTKISDYQGNIIYEYESTQGDQLIRPEHAFLISSILSDNGARAPMFGANSILNLPFQAAVKTGTTNDFRDNWTLGYTPDVAVGVWIGNADYTPMENTTGLSGAAPLWSQFMQFAVQNLTGGNVSPFSRPADIIEKEICEISGTEPSEWCKERRNEYFAYDQLPLSQDEDIWQNVLIDTWTGLKASPSCSKYTEEKFFLNVSDQWAKKWILESNNGQAWAQNLGFEQPFLFSPQEECQASDPQPNIDFANLSSGQSIDYSPLDIYIVAVAEENFKEFRLEYGSGEDPDEWTVLVDHLTDQYPNPESIYSWDLTDFPGEPITLQVHMDSTNNTFAEERIQLNIQVPTSTPTSTPTNTMTPTATQTVPPSQTPTLTTTPSATQTITETPP